MSSTNNEQDSKKSETKESEKADFIVTPWDVSGNIDYKKLIEKFGTQYIDQPLLEKFKKSYRKRTSSLAKTWYIFHSSSLR